MTTLYVGNLPAGIDEEALRGLFAAHGEVASVTVVVDPETGRPRGFGFVEMPVADAAQAAIDDLDGREHADGLLRVNVARDRGARPPRRAW